jgi:hypothetical protein
MTKIRSFLNPGGFAAALTCLVLTACGDHGGMDSGMMSMSDAYSTGDGGPMTPDAYMMPDHDAGMPDVDAGSDGGGTCTTGCTQRDLPPPMMYVDTAMIPGCMSTLNGSRTWGSDLPSHGCATGGIFRESGTNQWLLNFGCDGAGNPPYDGIFRLGSDGAWYANRENAATENSGELRPDTSCTNMVGTFYQPGGPSMTVHYWAE